MAADSWPASFAYFTSTNNSQAALRDGCRRRRIQREVRRAIAHTIGSVDPEVILATSSVVLGWQLIPDSSNWKDHDLYKAALTGCGGI
jgi:hypothetical protein